MGSLCTKPSKTSRTIKKSDPFCAICQEICNIDDDESYYMLKCKHTFHKECIKRWFKIKKQCPICRVDIDVDHLLIISNRRRRAFSAADMWWWNCEDADSFQHTRLGTIKEDMYNSHAYNDLPEYIYEMISSDSLIGRRACHRSATMWN